MTDNPYTVARPSEGAGKTTTVTTFWAELWRPMETNSHGQALISPRFSTEPECVVWVRSRRERYEQVGMWKRVSRAGNDYEDIPLDTEEAPLPDPARVHALVADLKAMLDKKKLDLDRHPAVKPYSRVSEFNPIERPLTYDEVYGEAGLLAAKGPVLDTEGAP